MTHILSMHNQATEIFSQHCSALRLRAPPTQLSEGSRLPSRSRRQHHPSARLLATVLAVAALVAIAAGNEVDFRAMGAVVPQQMMEVPYRDNASVAINFSYCTSWRALAQPLRPSSTALPTLASSTPSCPPRC